METSSINKEDILSWVAGLEKAEQQEVGRRAVQMGAVRGENSSRLFFIAHALEVVGDSSVEVAIKNALVRDINKIIEDNK